MKTKGRIVSCNCWVIKIIVLHEVTEKKIGYVLKVEIIGSKFLKLAKILKVLSSCAT